MSEEQLKAFLEAAKADAGLQEKLKAAGDADAVVAISKAAGFSITSDDIQSMSPESVELSDEELERASAGNCGSGTLWGAGVRRWEEIRLGRVQPLGRISKMTNLRNDNLRRAPESDPGQ